MRNGMKKMLILLLAVCLLSVSAGSMAESLHQVVSNASFDLEVTVGYNGVMTYGKVMPVRVRVRNFGDDFEGTLGVNAYVSGKEYDRYEKTIAVPAGSSREFELPLTVYARQDVFTAELVRDGEVICSGNGKPVTTVNPSAMMIGVLSTRPQNLKNLNIDRENDALGRYELWQTIPLTVDNFPEEAASLKSFGMLVIDDIDPASLSEKQQAALEEWLYSGRVLLCGGGANAARNVPYFSKYTGLSLSGVTTSDTLLASLEQLIGRGISGKAVTAAVAEYTGAESIGTDLRSSGKIYRSAVGAGRIYTMAFEAGDAKLNSESLMHYFWQQLLVDQDQDLYSTVMYSNADSDSYSYANASGYLPVTARSRMLPGVLIVAGMLLLACILWWILKKNDRRQWMWLVLPLIAAAASVSLLLLSTGAETNRPVAVIAENLVQNANGAIRNYTGITAAAPAYGRHSYSMAGDNLRVITYDYVDYDEDADGIEKNPNKMRTCYTIGGENTLTAESITPWTSVNLTVESAARVQGRINGAIWMEEDGFHGEIVNETDQQLAAGQVITSYGYASVKALAPGEKAEVLLKKSTLANPQNPEYKDGCMYIDNPGMYTVIDAAVGYNNAVNSNRPEDQEKAAASALINNAAERLRRDQGNLSYGAYESALFLYCAKPENREATEISVDGEPVEQKANTALLTAELSYEPVGRTGVIYHSAGMDLPVSVAIDENKMPVDKISQSGKNVYYFALSESPTFLFELKDLNGIKVTGLQVIENSYYVSQMTAYALNVQKQAWEEIELNKDIPNPERYIDTKGNLYVQFRQNGKDMYADINMPLINLEGRLEKNAED